MSTRIPQIVPVPSKKPVDPWVVGKRAGWKITDASTLAADQTITVDVVIIGTGAGGGITAEMLAASGLKVALIEEGPLKSSTDFNMKESEAYPAMYQEALGRRTLDGGVGILQGRTVGGGTTINWATSIRTPAPVLEYWQRRYGLSELTAARMDPWFRAVETRLGIQPWGGVPNANNAILSNGMSRLGYSWGILSPNVKGCANLGYCGLGCPINAKQSMLVTTLPTALALGARLYTRLRAQNYVFNAARDRVESLVCDALDPSGLRPSGRKVTFKAKHFVQAASAINGPGLLLRSAAPDPHGTLGKRTFVHPSAAVSGIFPTPVKAYEGLPQSVYSDHFLYRDAITGPLGFKLEVAPLHPVLVASSVAAIGEGHADVMRNFANYGTVISFARDGFHPDAPGGSVQLRADGSPILDYPLTPTVFEALRRAMKVQVDVQFAAGATRVFTGHQQSKPGGYTSNAELQAAIDGFNFAPGLLRMQSAHQMGGCGMSADPTQGVVNGDGRHHQLKNLSVHDASVFPTSLGANPQETIFALSARMTAKLALDIFRISNCTLKTS
ncbi:GMC family oxidoreductase N-terminal domain-containing protein [Rhizobacter sp. LjRoot28]|jgi:choline dehydrogenase-like flavoprotein|uniref:GMC family oxidoreductase N-terminal domain-containing protein n=1 Tax=Rhizobacter sp. LjRoot28 TaxID=3342309 RepID=UPI003ECC7EDE